MKFGKIVLIAAMVMVLAITGINMSGAAGLSTQPPAGAPGYEMQTGVISAITTTTSGIYLIKAPWPLRVIGFSAVGTPSGTCTLDVTNGTTSLLSTAMTLSTVVTAATLTTSTSTLNVAAGGTIQINTAGTGSATDVTYQLDVVRR